MNKLISDYIAAKKSLEAAKQAINRVANQYKKDKHKHWFSLWDVDADEEQVIFQSWWQGADCCDSERMPYSVFDEKVE